MFRITIALYWKCIILKAQDKIFCNEYLKSTLAVSVDVFAKIRACFWCTWWFNTAYIFQRGGEGEVEGKSFLLYEGNQHTGFDHTAHGGKQLRAKRCGQSFVHKELTASIGNQSDGEPGNAWPRLGPSLERKQVMSKITGVTSPCPAYTRSPNPDTQGGWRDKGLLWDISSSKAGAHTQTWPHRQSSLLWWESREVEWATLSPAFPK